LSLIVEDGTGKSDANGYTALAAATAYLTDYAVTSELASWTAAADAAKETALVLATQYLDNEYAGRWRGSRANETQALAWPRAYVEDADGFWVDADAVPQKLQDACAELALRVVLGDRLHPVETLPGDIASESVTVGPVSKTKTYVGGRPSVGYRYPKISMMLRPLIGDDGRVLRA
jgi:hypothetical protein